VADIAAKNEIHLNDGKDNFPNTVLFSDKGGRSYSVAVGDLDQNGSADIVIGNIRRMNRTYMNFQAGQFLHPIDFGEGLHATYGVVVSYINGDKYPEIVVANSKMMNYIFTTQ